MRKIDYEHWDRREIFDFFSPLSHPFYSVTFRLDVTELYRFCKENSLSFYYTMIYLVTHAVNENEAFLYTIRDGKVYMLDRREPSFTDRFKDEKYFHIVTMPCRGNLMDFCTEAQKRSHTQNGFINYASENGDLIYLSALPWLDLTALTNERDLDPDDTVPRISWGRFVEKDGNRTLGVSVEVNHRFVDGSDIGALARRLEEMIAEL